MNNCKKLLASAMALTMVATIAPVNVTGTQTVNAYDLCIFDEGHEVIFNRVSGAVEDIVDAIGGEDALAEAKADDEFAFDGSNQTIEEMLATEATWNGTQVQTLQEMLDWAARRYSGCMSDNMKFLQGYVAGVSSLTAKVEDYAAHDNMSDERVDEVLAGTEANAKAYIEGMQVLLNNLTSVNAAADVAYVGNLDADTASDYEDLVARITEIIQTVSDAFSLELSVGYAADLLDAIEAEYPELVKTTTVTGGSTSTRRSIIEVSEFTWSERRTSRTGSTYELSELINDIEEDNLDGVRGYDNYSETDAVVTIMDALNDLLDASEALDDIVDELEASQAAERIGSSSKATAIANLISTTGDTVSYTSRTLLGKVFADITTADRVEKFIANVDAPEFEALQEVMGIVENFFTVSVRTTGSRYTTRLEDTEYFNNLEAVFTAAGVPLIDEENALFDIYVDANGDATEQTNYEALVARMETVATAYETVTTGVRGITVNNISSSNVARVVAARDALRTLDAYYDNLTGAQKNAVEDARTNIQLLYAKALVDGIATDVVTGWVDLGNGNWDYYDENGTAFTGWVCTATDTWYYVSNGHMLRNAWVWRDATSAYYVGNDGVMLYGPATTPDGYTIDANGLWHA